MNDMVELSRTNPSIQGYEDTPRNVFTDGMLGLTFITYGKDRFATPDNTRPKCDAWRLRWWYHSTVVINHRKTIGGQCRKAFVHRLHGLLPLAVAKRWSCRRSPFLDLLVFEEEGGQS